MIEKRTLANGRRVYRVRWRDGGRGSHEHARSFDRHEDAVRFETDIRRRKQLGELADLENGRETLDEWAREWFRTYARPNLAGHTLAYYARAWDKHVLPSLGEYELRRITPAVIAEFADDLRREGAGDATIRKVLSLVQSVLGRAVVVGRIRANPVVPVRKPSQGRRRAVRPLTPTLVEQLRRLHADGARPDARVRPRLRGATPRRGPRPDVGRRRRAHDPRRAVCRARGGEGDKNADKPFRPPTRTAQRRPQDAADATRAAGRRGADLPAARRRTVARHRLAQLARRVFQAAAESAGLGTIRPYDLRHSFVSLLIAERRTIIDVARQAGHSPTMALNTYGHVFDQLEGANPPPRKS